MSTPAFTTGWRVLAAGLALCCAARSAPARQTEPATAPAAQAQTPAAPSRYRGRVLFEDGTAVAGLDIEIQGNRVRPDEPGAPFVVENFESATVRTGADGRFELECVLPRNFQFVLTLRLEGHVGRTWRWNTPSRAETRDFGTVVLRRGGRITGRVVDAQGRALGDRWTVYCDPVRTLAGKGGGDALRPQTMSDPDSGRFTLADLAPGTHSVRAYSRQGDWAEAVEVDVQAGETSEVLLSYTGPDNARRVVVLMVAQPFYTFANEIDALVLRGAGLEPRSAQRDPRSPQRMIFEDVPDGSYTLELTDDVYRTWTKSGVQPGESLQAQLVGAASARIQVFDAATGARLEHWGLRVRLEDLNVQPKSYDLRRRNSPPPIDDLVEGLLPKKQTLIVLAEGYAPAEQLVERFDPLAPPALRFELGPGLTLRGRLLSGPERAPLAGVEVVLENKGDVQAGVWSPWAEDRSRRTKSGPDGAYVFTGLAPSQYELSAQTSFLVRARYAFPYPLPPLPVAAPAPVPGAAPVADAPPAADAPRDTVDLLLPAVGTIRGRVLAGEELDLQGLHLAVVPAEAGPELRSAWQNALGFGEFPAGFELGPDGSFRVTGVPAGAVDLELVLPARDPNDNNGVYEPRTRIPLGRISVPAGQESEHAIDARAKAPVCARATVLVNGQPLAGVLVEVRVAGRPNPVATLRTDESGVGYSGLFLSAKASFVLRGPGDAWSYAPPEETLLQPGELAARAWELYVVEAATVFVDAAGAPLARRMLQLTPEIDGRASTPVVALTDAAGVAQLTLVPGRHRVVCEARGSLAALGGEFVWTSVGVEGERVELR